MQVLKGIVPEPTQPGAPAEGTPLDHQQLLFCERFLEFAVDLLSQLPTRRFVRTLLDDRVLLVKCRLSGLFGHQQGALLALRRELTSCRVLRTTTPMLLSESQFPGLPHAVLLRVAWAC